ncbi:MAG: ATP-dependent helicase [Chlamydiae bacterium]|nr:ATP-dependent helicase [Chlamydiota bacterium]
MLSSLNPEQRKAVLTTKGRVLVLAGAGSGKTSVLTKRIAYLVQEEGVPPETILGLTFTNKAAGEMRSRLALLIPPAEAKKVVLCTFHSFCMQLLREQIHHLGFTHAFSLYGEKEVKRILTHLVRQELAHEGELPSLEETMQQIVQAKSQGLSRIIPLKTVPQEGWYAKFSEELLGKLSSCMRSYNAVDFDGLLSLSLQLFTCHPAVLQIYQNRYKYLLIDEYQDTNPIQYQLASLLAERHGNLFVVGDDDQSIYGWRGAEIKNILNFPSDTTIKLEQNYRSSPSILRAANALIAHNKERHIKSLWSHQSEESKVLLFHAPNDLEEAQSVAQRILWYHKQAQVPWHEMAILYRSNALSKSFELALSQTLWEDNGIWRKGIPYEVFGGTEFYERAEIKDLLAYLRVIANPQDEEALLRILNVPRRGLSDEALHKLTTYNREQELPLWDVLLACGQDPEFPLRAHLSTRALQGLQNFISLIQSAKEHSLSMPLHLMLEKLIEDMQYKKTIKEEAKSDTMRDFKWDNVLSCIGALAAYEKNKEGIPSLQDFLATTALDPAFDSSSESTKKNDKVRLMTIHSAKGLEFTTCFVVCLEDHLIPHERSLEENTLEEERRLLYVAMTRAKQHLILSMARERNKLGKLMRTLPSRFLLEIPKELFHIIPYKTIAAPLTL